MRVARLAMPLALFRWDGSDRGGESRVCCPIHGTVPNRGARRVFAQIIIAIPIFRWSNRSRREAAAAVRADFIDDRVDAGGAKRALVGANARFERIGRQQLVAIFAGRSELEPSGPLDADSFFKQCPRCSVYLMKKPFMIPSRQSFATAGAMPCGSSVPVQPQE